MALGELPQQMIEHGERERRVLPAIYPAFGPSNGNPERNPYMQRAD